MTCRHFQIQTKLSFLLRPFTTQFLPNLPPLLVKFHSIRPQFDGENAINSHAHMEETLEYQSLDPRFYTSSLQNCKNLPQIRQVHAQILVSGALHNLIVANKLLYVYTQFKATGLAYKVFDKMPERDLVSWSLMVGGFYKAKDYDNCFRVFREIIRSFSVRPDNYTLSFVIRACRDTMDFEMGRLVHHVVYKFGLHKDPFVLAVLVDMYAKLREIDDSRRLFDKMPVRDLVTWTVMIGAYANFGDPKEGLALFDQMRDQGVVPDKMAMVNVVYACAKLGSMYKAKLVHDYICNMKFSLDVILGTAMIDMYSKRGSVDSGREIFDQMKEKNVKTWSAMIAAYGYHGQGSKALDLFKIMIKCRILPNSVTFISLLYACSHAGLVDEGLEIFSMMQESYSIKPDVKHCTCVVDLLGRAGRFEEAWNLIKNITVAKDEGLWGALLGECRKHGNLELAKKAAKSLLELEPRNSGHYILLSNIYAKAQKWQNMAEIRELMTHKRLKKVSGWTQIEFDDMICRFSVGDRTHPRSKEIYEMLDSLRDKLDKIGYVPDTSCVLHDVDEDFKEEMLETHSEKLAIAFGLLATPERTPIRITKNLRICGDCHTYSKLVSLVTKRLIIARDANRFHHFSEGCLFLW